MDKMIPLSVPNFEGNEKKYVNEAIDETWVSTGGKFIDRMEENLANYLNVKKAMCCQSGTSGIHLSLVDINITENDMVFVPTLTFIAAVNPVMYMKAEPIFVDCDNSLCIDPIKLENFIIDNCIFDGKKLKNKKNNKVIKAIIVVHVFGNMCDMEKINEIAKKYNLIVIEDATEAIGTYYLEGRYKGCYAGTIGDYGVFSFNGNKIITTGGGGAVVAKNIKSVEHMKFLSTQAKTDPHYYLHDEVGYNYRMTNLQAALGVAQLEELEEFIKRKQKFYEIYKEEFLNYDKVELLRFRDGVRSNKWFFALLINTIDDTEDLRKLIENLKIKKIETRPIWGLIHKQKPYLAYETTDMTISEYYVNRIINIPASTNLNEEDIIYVSKMIKKELEEI